MLEPSRYKNTQLLRVQICDKITIFVQLPPFHWPFNPTAGQALVQDKAVTQSELLSKISILTWTIIDSVILFHVAYFHGFIVVQFRLAQHNSVGTKWSILLDSPTYSYSHIFTAFIYCTSSFNIPLAVTGRKDILQLVFFFLKISFLVYNHLNTSK